MKDVMDWSDYSVLLAIAESGSLAAAARSTGQSHPTMMRRLNAIEARLGARVFERFRHGYQPTVAGEALLKAARDMREIATEAERKVAGRDNRPTGSVVLTTTDTLFAGLLAPILAPFRNAFPGIVLDIRVSNDVYDLARRDAEIALRPSSDPELNLAGRRLGLIRQALYVPAETNGSVDEVPMLGPSADMPYGALHAWMKDAGLDARCVLRFNSILSMYNAARIGAGAAILPTYLADDDASLRRTGEPIAALETELWLLVHPDLRKTARVRAVLDYLAGNIRLD